MNFLENHPAGGLFETEEDVFEEIHDPREPRRKGEPKD